MTIPNSNCTPPNHAWPNTGILSQETIEPGAMQSGALDPTLWQQTTYTLDAYGNRTSVTVAGFDKAANLSVSRQTTIVYDQNHQFVSQKKYSLGPTQSITENFTFNPSFGKPATYTDANNLQSNWHYDTFGRKTLEVHPDGTQTAFSYVFCNTSNCPAGDAYAVVTTPQAADGSQNGPLLSIHYDILDRETNRYTQGFDGSWIQVFTRYDGLGRVAQKTRPFFQNGGTAQWTVYTYDALGRVTAEIRT